MKRYDGDSIKLFVVALKGTDDKDIDYVLVDKVHTNFNDARTNLIANGMAGVVPANWEMFEIETKLTNKREIH